MRILPALSWLFLPLDPCHSLSSKSLSETKTEAHRKNNEQGQQPMFDWHLATKRQRGVDGKIKETRGRSYKLDYITNTVIVF